MNIRKNSNGELDELFMRKVDSLHIERMDGRCFCIIADGAKGEKLRIMTGIEKGKWFFLVEEESTAFSAKVERPASYRKRAEDRR